MRARIALVAVFLAAACSSPEQQLVGAWESRDGTYVNRLELRTDGTFTGVLQRVMFGDTTTPLGTYSGRWKFAQGRFNINVESSTVEMMAPDYSFSHELVDVSNEQFVIRSEKNHEETWQRVP